jgi:hypothetical protein
MIRASSNIHVGVAAAARPCAQAWQNPSRKLVLSSRAISSGGGAWKHLKIDDLKEPGSCFRSLHNPPSLLARRPPQSQRSSNNFLRRSCYTLAKYTAGATTASDATMATSKPDQFRLPTDVRPTHYDVTIKTDLEKLKFEGFVKIECVLKSVIFAYNILILLIQSRCEEHNIFH